MCKELTWKEYLQCNTTPDNSVLSEVFERCEDFISFLSKLILLKREMPCLIIVKSDKSQAGHKNGNIYIYEGLIKQFKTDNNSDIHLNHGISCYFLFWIIAHEFFHYSQQHSRIKEKFGNTYNKSLEFDADRLAIFALYEFSKESLVRKSIEFDVKEAVLLCIFYPVKRKISSENYVVYEEATHPFWMLRLYYMLTLLASFGNKNVFSPESISDQIRLTKVLSNLETDYKNNTSYTADTTNLSYYLVKYSEQDFQKLGEDYEKIRPLLNSYH